MALEPQPLPVSVVIPTYNRAAFTLQAIESVLEQSFPPQEIVVVDDGSTDETPEVLAGLEGRVRYIRRRNGGIASARNTGVRHARGRYIAFLDSDDLWAPRRLEAMFATLGRARDERASAIATAAHMCDAQGRPTGKIVGSRTPRLGTGDLLLRHKGRINGTGILVEREVLTRLGGFREDLDCAEDCDLLLRLSRLGPILIVPEPLLLYRCHSGNISSTHALRDAASWIRLLDHQTREDPALVEEHAAALRRCYASQYRRLGKRLLEGHKNCPRCLAAARDHLWRSLCLRPYSLRTWRYAFKAWVARPALPPAKPA
jgi:glycosyltransferase involved in cell wall biosynthesis